MSNTAPGPMMEDNRDAPVMDVPDPYDIVYTNLPKESHVVKPDADCKFCGAIRLYFEPPGFCCRSGKVELANQDTPPELMKLWTASDAASRHFRDHIRWFNGHFSFTSMYATLDEHTTNLAAEDNPGIYTFRASGVMHHNIRGFGKDATEEPRHLELYFYDEDPNLELRYRAAQKRQKEMDREVIAMLINILKGNPYSEGLRKMGDLENIEDYCINLNLDKQLDQRTYNRPTADEVAAVWVES